MLNILSFLIPIPFRTDRSLRTVPYVTYTLLFLNILVFLCTQPFSYLQYDAFIDRWGLTLTHPSLRCLATYGFIHYDSSHLVGNMLIFWIVGTVLESGIGSLLFLLVYFSSLIGAVLLYGVIGRFFHPESLGIPLIGASGAIAGVIGFAMFRYYHIRIRMIVLVPNVLGIIPSIPAYPFPLLIWVPFWGYAAYWGGKELLNGILQLQVQGSDNVAHWAHLGGMGLGLLAGLLLRSFREGQRESTLEDSARSAMQGLSQRSFDELQRLLLEHPDDPEVLEAMAGVVMANGNADESRTLYMKAIPLFLKQGLPVRAAISYLNVLRAFPLTTFPPHEQLTLSSLLENQGHYPEAARAFLLIAESYPDSGDAQTALLRAAQIHARNLHDPSRAIDLLHHLLQRYPDSPWHSLAKDRLSGLEQLQCP